MNRRRDTEIKELYLSGLTQEAIGNKYGIIKQRVGQILKRAGLVGRLSRLAHRNEQIRNSYRAGSSLQQIVDTFGLKTEGSVIKILHKAGITTSKPKLAWQEKFQALVDSPHPITGCREWLGRKMNGYGLAPRGAPDMLAHRVAWILAYGEIPDSGDNSSCKGKTLNINHKLSCSSKACCEIAHLYPGTQKENMEDREKSMTQEAKQRRSDAVRKAVHGLRPNAKLTEAQVLVIRRSESKDAHALAESYGIGYTQIRRIQKGQQWDDIR